MIQDFDHRLENFLIYRMFRSHQDRGGYDAVSKVNDGQFEMSSFPKKRRRGRLRRTDNTSWRFLMTVPHIDDLLAVSHKQRFFVMKVLVNIYFLISFITCQIPKNSYYFARRS
jgi:hypothetical protein